MGKAGTAIALDDDRYAGRIVPILHRSCDYKSLSWTLGALQMIDFTATFEDGVLKPDRELGLSPGTRVRLFLEPLEHFKTARSALDELDRLCDEFPIDSGGALLTRDQLHERR